MRRISKSLLLLLLVGSVFGFNASNLYAQEETEKKEFTVEQYKAVTEMITALQKRVDELNNKSSDNLDEAKKYANTLASSTEQLCRDLVTSNLESSVSYTDSKTNTIITDVKSYANSLASSTEQACKALVAPEVESVKTYADTKANSALTDAKAYADEKANKALTDAKSYADSLSNSSAITSIAQGSKDGSIAVTANGNTTDVEIKGLGSAAFTKSEDYAKAKHSHTTDSAMSETSKNPVQNKVIKEYIDAEIKKAVEAALKSSKEYTDSCTKGDFNVKDDCGYVKLPNGIIIQWISTQIAKTQGNAVVKLPTSFSSKNYAVTGSLVSVNDAVYSTHHMMMIHSKSLNNFVVTNNNHKGANWDGTYQFIAIGK